MIRHVHPVAAAITLATITAFWTGTVATELFGGPEAVAMAKRAILWGFLILVPAVIATGATGMRMSAGGGGRGTDPLVTAKRRRMPFIAANGLFVLMPSAFYLDHLASHGLFDTAFLAVQGLELAAGALNITLLGCNARDGIRLVRRTAANGLRTSP